MMIHKRLIETVGDSKKYIAGNVAAQWLSLAANIAIMTAVTSLLAIMSLPQGYDTPVGELGDTLSGGERQRLGLARAFLHDAPFLLLDKPTSNLDSLNEAVILKSLREGQEGKTAFVWNVKRSIATQGQGAINARLWKPRRSALTVRCTAASRK